MHHSFLHYKESLARSSKDSRPIYFVMKQFAWMHNRLSGSASNYYWKQA